MGCQVGKWWADDGGWDALAISKVTGIDLFVFLVIDGGGVACVSGELPSFAGREDFSRGGPIAADIHCRYWGVGYWQHEVYGKRHRLVRCSSFFALFDGLHFLHFHSFREWVTTEFVAKVQRTFFYQLPLKPSAWPLKLKLRHGYLYFLPPLCLRGQSSAFQGF